MDNEKNDLQLDSPLVVHKESDASYQPVQDVNGMTATHTEDELDAPTIERHRFKKKKKSGKGGYIFLLIIVAAVAVCSALYFTGTYDFGIHKETTTEETTRKSYTTQQVNKFEGIITVKGTYIFFEGSEVDGIEGLTREIKYLDPGTKFTVQDENADSNFLNYEILPLLADYQISYEVTHIVSSGLTSKYEKTTAKTTSATKANEKNTTEKAATTEAGND